MAKRLRTVLRWFSVGIIRWVLWTLLVIPLLLGAASIQSLAWLFAPFGGWLAGFVYPSLPFPADGEQPPTFRQFPPSAMTQTVMGGRGEGLNCSLPPVGKAFFKAPSGSADVSLHFRPSCVMHDLCYRHGAATYGYTQADCDYALQASAFRMCRQVRKAEKAVEKPQAAKSAEEEKVEFEDCQKQAKKVLLGVSLGGGQSFRAGEDSTYFEYDPMPEKADDYVIARAYEISPEQAAAGELGVFAYHFHRNSVTAQALKVNPGNPQRLLDSRSAAVPWPGQYIPTAPTAEWLGGGESALMALSRKGAFNTNLEFVKFDTRFKDGKTTLNFLTCPIPLKRCPVDSPAIGKMARMADGPALISLKRVGSESAKASMGLGQWNLETAERITHRLGDSPSIGSRYRFLQNELLLEKDAEGQNTHAWVLARGYDTDDGSIRTPEDGQGYRDRMLVVRQSLISGKASTTTSLPVAESGDPLFVVRLAPGAGVALAGLQRRSPSWWNMFSGTTPDESATLLTLWHLQDDGNSIEKPPISLPPPLDQTFIDRPPMVVDLAGIAAPVIVWTHVSDDRQTPALDLVLTALDPGQSPLPVLGAFKCELSLAEQIDLAAATNIREKAKYEKDANDSSAKEAAKLKALKDLLRRWKTSQTLVSSKPNGEGPADLAVTTVLNGFPRLSFQVVLKNENGGFTYKQVLPDAPHFKCGAVENGTLVSRQANQRRNSTVRLARSSTTSENTSGRE
ncbi:hypothetical protein ACX3YG_11120 [Pseudomonas wadenswilerensis]